MRSNRLCALATAAMLPLAMTACGVIGDHSDSSTVVIGADLELTGAYAAVGKVYQQALQLEIQQINAAGGADGHPLRLDVHDNHSDPQTAVTDIASITSTANLGAVVTGACSTCLAAVAQTLGSKKIPTIALAPMNLTSLSEAGNNTGGTNQWIFKINPNAEDDALELAGLVANNLKSNDTVADTSSKSSRHGSSTESNEKSYSIIATDDAYGQELEDAMTAQASKQHLREASFQKIAAGATDSSLRTAVQRALSSSPDALVIAALPDQSMQAFSLARQEAYQRPVFFDSISAGDLFPATANQLTGVTMVAPQSLVIDDVIATSPALTTRKQWFEAYTSKYGNFSGYSLYAGDAVQVIAKAIQDTHTTDAQTLRSDIENMQLGGYSGALRFTPDNHSGLTPGAITPETVTNDGRWHLATN